MSKSMCICGATNILADDLLPNKTLRDTINRIMESNNNSGENGGSAFQAQGLCPVDSCSDFTHALPSFWFRRGVTCELHSFSMIVFFVTSF